MNKEELLQAIGSVDDRYIEEAAPRKKAKKTLTRWLAAVACAGLLIGAALAIPYLLNGGGDEIDLKLSSGGVHVKYIDKAPDISQTWDLKLLTAEEILAGGDTAAFRGTVTDIRNVEIDFNGSKEYRAILTVNVDAVYRGACVPGDTVSVLVPCPIDMEGYHVEDTDVVSNLRVGMAGIFLPVRYNDSYYYAENGATVYWSDFAQYGLPDGMQYAFLDTEEGLRFCRETYTSVSPAASLDDVAQYISSMTEEETS